MVSQINTATLRRFGIKPRTGKTARDRVDGAHRRNEDNKALRAEWRQKCRENDKSNPPFPEHTCKGKGNSSKALKFSPAKAIKH